MKLRHLGSCVAHYARGIEDKSAAHGRIGCAQRMVRRLAGRNRIFSTKMKGRPVEGVARRSDVNHPTRLPETRDFSAGYKRSHRLYETGGIVAAVACAGALAVRVTLSGNLSG